MALVPARVVYKFVEFFDAQSPHRAPWSVQGSKSIQDQYFTLDQNPSGYVPESVAYFSHGVGECPSVMFNPTAKVLSWQGRGASLTWQPGEVSMHPGPRGEYAHIKFTAPSKGSYKLKATFMGLDDAPTTTDVHVFANGSELWTHQLNSHRVPVKLKLPNISLGTGQQIDVAVGWGANSNYTCDTTGVKLVIYKVGEP